MTLKNPISPPNPMKLVAFTWIFDLTPGYVLFTMCEALLNKIFGGGNHCSHGFINLFIQQAFTKSLLYASHNQYRFDQDI